jgi:hypothetical protein
LCTEKHALAEDEPNFNKIGFVRVSEPCYLPERLKTKSEKKEASIWLL